ncbi:MAG: prepilin-type N-terminal cleavage/methylation domain-containing protein [Gemmatimonadetes bacterium]|nr:prepilin-type N-terminal cleavage/methylation domain-containing protein [Gemmatimonadota bacterium]
MSMTRRGFTLVELLVAMTVGTLIMGAIYQSLIGIQRLMATHSERIEVQQSLRAGAFYITRALRELDASDGDIEIANSDQIRFRGMRWSSMVCATPADMGGNAQLLIRDAMTMGSRGPDASLDSVLVFYQGDPRDAADDTWIIARLSATSATTCDDGDGATDTRLAPPAQTLYDTLAVTAGAARIMVATGVLTGAPIRGFQQEELRVSNYWNGRPWIMQRLATNSGGWNSWEGLLGPLQTSDGLELTYYDASGNVTAVLTNIASVGIVLRAESNRAAYTSGGTIDNIRDSIVTRVALRND